MKSPCVCPPHEKEREREERRERRERDVPSASVMVGGAKAAVKPLSQRPVDVFFLSFFVTHIPTSLLVDAQCALPSTWFPKHATQLLEFHLETFKDPLVSSYSFSLSLSLSLSSSSSSSSINQSFSSHQLTLFLFLLLHSFQNWDCKMAKYFTFFFFFLIDFKI